MTKEKPLKNWSDEERAVTLTNGQWSTLTMYLIMTTKYREGEAEAWADLAQRKEEDGSPQFKNAASNAEFWKEMIEAVESTRKEIDNI